MFFDEDPFEIMKEMQRKIEKLQKEFFRREKEFFGNKFFRTPTADLFDEGNKIVARIDLPGVEKNDINIHATENSLEISASSKKEKQVQKKNYYKQERSSVGYHRYFTLPEKIIPEKVKATYKNGVLEVEMEKAEKKKAKKKVSVKVR